MLANAGVYMNYHREHILKLNFKKLKVHKKLSAEVGLLKVFPGITQAFVNSILNSPGLKALVLETFGSGNATTEKWFVDALTSAIKKDIIIVNVSQCITGRVEQGKYETSTGLKQIGIIGGNDITTEAALTKLMVLIGRGFNVSTINNLMQQSIRGEITV